MNKLFKLKDSIWLSWYFLILYYFILRGIFGIEYWLIYSFAIFMIILKFEFEKISLIFFTISLISFILATPTEANHYMSFVFGFLVLTLVKILYLTLKERFTENEQV